MSSKHFINDSSLLVLTALQSVTYTNPTTALDRENKIIYVRPDAIKKQVSIVSGGGAGHEPSFSSFVGPGLLAGAVSGTIFASPSAEQIRRCIFGRVDTSQGVLVIVMNYTGDVLNFGMAVEKAKAAGIKVEMVVVGDDAGVCRKQGGKVGRRGIAGTVLVQKIAGALAAAGASLHEVHNMAKAVAENTVSIGSSLSHVHVPGRGVGGDDDLKADEVEIGMGIHNETGSERVSSDLPGTVTRMLKHMLDQHDEDRAFLKVNSGDQTVLLVNNLGGTSVLEMGGITTEVVTQLEADWKIKPVRILAGTYMTSLNGLGFSISLLRLTEGRMLELLDAPAEAAGWTAAVKTHTWTSRPAETREGDAGLGSEVAAAGISVESSYAKAALNAALDSVIEAEPEVTKYDSIVGDGDCGIGLKRGAQAVKEYLRAAEETDAALLLDGIIEVVESAMDGTSGALYAIFLNALANGIRQQKGQETQSATPQIWAHALARAMESLSRYTPARVGDRTLMDALSPFADELKSSGSVQSAAAAAEKGAENTKGMKASLGRTVYIGGDGYDDIPDPGAYGLAQFFKGLAVGLQ